LTWLPAHEAHAIERVSVTFQLPEPTPTKPWLSSLEKATSQFAIAGFGSTDGVDINLPVGGALPVQPVGAFQPAAPAPLSGRLFQRVIDGQVFESVEFHRSRLIYFTTRYERWDDFKKRSLDLIGSYLDEFLQFTSINALKLEYWDRFTFDGPQDAPNYGELLRRDSRHVPGFCLDQTNLWHAHVGYFSPAQKHEKRLINLNLDAIDLAAAPTNGGGTAELRRSVGIYSMALDSYGAESPNSAAEAVLKADEQHTILKALLKDVITEPMVERISLNAGEKL
jgi:uncharacterized protein (TIGR04255 family)